MSELDRLERDLTVWFADTGAPRTPPYLDDILRQTAHRRQRPRWTFPERLLPMSTTVSFRAVRTGVPWRPLVAVGLLIVALLVAALVAGATQQRLPAPFGPAAAGLVAYASDGDIFVADPVSGEARPIVTGADEDRDPQWSLDGTRIVFERAGSDLVRLFTVRPDGSELKAITHTQMYIKDDPDGPTYAFSPDGRSVLFVGNSKLQIARADGSGVRTLDTGEVLPYEAAWRPPDGSQIAVLGPRGGLHLVETATGSTRTLVAPADGVDSSGPRWSPDGSQFSYHAWSTVASTFTVRARIFDIASGKDRLADQHGDDVFWDASGAWSNDGKRMAIARGHVDGYADVTVAILPADGPGPRVETEHGLALAPGCCAAFEWAPDDSWLLWTAVDAAGHATAQLLIDPDTGAVTTPPWQTVSDPAWQRLAP